MAFTATPTDGSGTPIPMSSAVPDGTNTPLAIEGGPSVSTGGNNLVPVSMYVKDGNDIAQGTSTDAANVNSVIGQLKQIKTNTTSVTLASLPTGANTIGAVTQASGPWTANITQVGGSAITLGSKVSASSYPVVIASDQGSMPMSQSGTWNVGLNAGAAVIGSTTIQATSGTALVADQTNSELRTSNYVTKTTAGDTPLTLGSATSANSLPMVVASDQSAFPINQGASAAAGTAWRTKGDFVEQAGLSAGALNADLVPSTDVSAYKFLSLHVTGIATGGTLTFQASNDGVNFVSYLLYRLDTAAAGNAGSSTGTAGVIWGAPVVFRYFRVRQTAWTSGASTGVLELYTSPGQFTFIKQGVTDSNGGTILSTSNALNVSAAQSGVWTVGHSNADITVVPSAAYTATQLQVDQTNTAARGLRVVLNMTVVGTGSVTLEIDAKDVASGAYVAMLTGVAVTTNSTNTYVVYPGLTPAANAVVSDVLPKTWRIKTTANNANSATYSVGASYLI